MSKIPCDDSVRHYLFKAVAPSTRAAYDTAVGNYHRFCRSRGIHDYSINACNVAAWAAALADRGQHAYVTIRAYVSAVSTTFVDRSIGSEGADAQMQSNPTLLPWVTRVLKGIANDRAEIDARHRSARSAASQPLTMDTVIRIKNEFLHEDPKLQNFYLLSLFAATALGVTALLRPNALLGQPNAKGQLDGRGVFAQHLTFFRRNGRRLTRKEEEVPDHLHLLIPKDKNDQLALGQTRVVSHPLAVATVWRVWRLSPPQGRLFRQPSGTPMWPLTLMTHLRELMVKAGEPDADKITAKCFRKGGASTLADAGATGADIGKAGGWMSNTYLRYIGAEQHHRRALATARSMESGQ